MKFDIEDYLESNFGARLSGTKRQQLVMDCPMCGKKDGLYVNLEEDGDDHPRGAFICYSCDDPLFRGKNFTQFYATVEGIEWREARQRMMLESNIDFGAIPSAPRQARPPKKRIPVAKAEGRSIVEIMRALIPEYIPCFDGARWRVPKYMKDRRVSRDTCRSYDIGYATEGRFANRIILPVVTPAGVDYTARSTDPNEYIRYLSGPHAGEMVYGFYQAKRLIETTGLDFVVIVEGPFDVLGFARVGIPAVGLLGKSTISLAKVEMARSTGAERLLLCLDAGERNSAVSHANRLGLNVMIVEDLEGYKDSGDAPDDVLLRVPERAASIGDAWGRSIREKLDRIRI